MLNGYIPGLRYNIKGSVATSRAMPTPFFFSRLPEALCGLMTKQTPSCIHNTVSSPSIALIKHSLNYIKTSNNIDSLKSRQPLFSGQITCPQLTIIYVSNLPRSVHLTILCHRTLIRPEWIPDVLQVCSTNKWRVMKKVGGITNRPVFIPKVDACQCSQ